MEHPQIQTIIALLQRTFNGKAWHGPNVLSVLQTLSLDQLSRKRGNSNSIIELVGHIHAWRVFTIKKLSGDIAYEVSDALNFPSIELTEANWKHLLDQLQQSQEDLLALLEQQEDAILQQIVPGKNYAYYELLYGSIHHDLYHLGQIILLQKHT